MRAVTAILRAPEMLECLRASVADHAPAECAMAAGSPCWPHRIIAKVERADARLVPPTDPDHGRRGD